MFENQRILAVIPARGGSKGLPGKNLRNLADKPLINWSIEAALASPYIDRTIVSTDCRSIAATAEKAGADVPFLRPDELACDHASSMDVFLHALKWSEDNGEPYDLLVILQPTSPLRTTDDINNALKISALRKAKAVVSVCQTDHHPWWSNTLPEDGNMCDFIRPEVLNKNRQELPTYYQLNGAIYLVQTDFLKRLRSFYGPESYAYKMPAERSIDIDTLQDFLLAEALKKRELETIATSTNKQFVELNSHL